MKSELSFLMDLFLDDEVPGPIKKIVAKRIRDVEANLTVVTPSVPRGTPQLAPSLPPAISLGPNAAQQSPSMQRIMAAHPEVPVVVAAPTTPAAAAALQQRAAIIHKGLSSDKPEPGRSGPRKF